QLQTVTIPPIGGRTTYVYKTLGQNVRRLEVEMTPSARTTYIYDNDDNRVATVNPLGDRSTLIRVANGRVIADVNPLGARTSYLYGNDGRNSATINPLGARTTMVYDSLAQLIA